MNSRVERELPQSSALWALGTVIRSLTPTQERVHDPSAQFYLVTFPEKTIPVEVTPKCLWLNG